MKTLQSFLLEIKSKRAGRLMRKVDYLCDRNPKKAAKYVYYNAFYRFPNFRKPKTINEKLQVLKLGKYYNNPIISCCVDKLQVKEYLQKLGYGALCAKTYWYGKDTNSIPWEELPKQFVIKCNHGCGYNLLIDDKFSINKGEIVDLLNKWLEEEQWKLFAEFQYKNVDRSILIEQYLGDRIETYKFYCFHGVPKVIYLSQADENGNADKYLDYYDIEWNHLDIYLGEHPHNPKVYEKPKNLDKMLEVARDLSKPFPFVRVDLYSIDGTVYFSEFTFLPTGGYMQLIPEYHTTEWGEWLHL